MAKNKKIPSRILGDFVNANRTKYLRYDLLEGKYTYSYCIKETELNFYSHFKPKSKSLTIMLPGAVNRSKTIYNYQRHSWSDEIDGSVISFLDPTVASDNDITIGWFQGSENAYAIPILISFIKNILKINNITEDNLTLFGSSAGGFTSLKIANEFPSSRVIVINPQTQVFRYFKKEYEKLISYVFPGQVLEQVTKLYNDRLKISLSLENRLSPVLYYQNLEDKHHVQFHLTPLLDSINEDSYEIVDGLNQEFYTDKMLKVIYYSDIQSGHSPLGKEDSIKIMRPN